MNFYIQLDSSNVIRDALNHQYADYKPVEIESPLPVGILGGWYRWDGDKPVYDRALFERVNEVPDLQATKEEYESIKPVIAELALEFYEKGEIDAARMKELVPIFPEWTTDFLGPRGIIVHDEGSLYRSLHDVTNAAQNTKPSATPSMWTQIADPAEEWPKWMPYDGTVRYMNGSKVTHAGKRWISTVDNNVWDPGVYGWTEYRG